MNFAKIYKIFPDEWIMNEEFAGNRNPENCPEIPKS